MLFFKEHVDWQFDWGKEWLTGYVKKDFFEYSLASPIHDPMSFQLPMRAALMEGGKSFAFQFMRHNRPVALKFEVIGEELLLLPNGRVHTLIIKQLWPLQSKQKKLIWVAPELEFVPIRFATFDDGKIENDILVERLWLDDEEVTFQP